MAVPRRLLLLLFSALPPSAECSLSWISDQIFGPSSEPTTLADLEWAPLLEFYDRDYRDLTADSLPTRACTSARKSVPLWQSPFVRLRLRITPDSKPSASQSFWKASAKLKLKHIRPERSFCRWLGAAGLEGNYFVKWLCVDCTKRVCEKAASMVSGAMPGTPDFAVDLPPRGKACVWLEKMPGDSRSMRVTWEQQLDPSVFVRLGLGALLVWYYLSLRESSLLHAAIGGVGSLFLMACLVAWWLLTSTRDTVRGSVPLGGFITSVVMLACALVPALRQALVTVIVPNSSTDFMAWLSLRDPIWGLPIGWIAFALLSVLFCSTVIYGARWSQWLFASAPDPEGEVHFMVDENTGRRIDILPPTPLPQRCFGFSLWLLGMALLLQCTHIDNVSLALAVVVLAKDILVHYAFQAGHSMWRDEFVPSHHRMLVSSRDFENQGKSHTAMALKQLQEYIQTNSDALYKFTANPTTELNLRRFADGSHHCNPPMDFNDDYELTSWWPCPRRSQSRAKSW